MGMNEIYNEDTISRAAKLVAEAVSAANNIRAMFADDTRGMMLFMYAMAMLQDQYQGLLERDKAHVAAMMAEWIAAGEPADLTQVTPIILEKKVRMSKEPVN